MEQQIEQILDVAMEEFGAQVSEPGLDRLRLLLTALSECAYRAGYTEGYDDGKSTEVNYENPA